MNFTPAALATRPASLERGKARPKRGSKNADGGLTIERITLAVGCLFVLVNACLFFYFMPSHTRHQHHTTRSEAPIAPSIGPGSHRRAASLSESRAPSSARAPTSSGHTSHQPAHNVAPAPLSRTTAVPANHASGRMMSPDPDDATAEPDEPNAALVMARWLAQCSQRPRCACIQHGIGSESMELFRAFRSVAFFVLLPGPRAQQFSTQLSAANLSHVYVMRADLQTKGTAPMANDVLNPRGERLTALQALRVSNEFFDLQIVHSSSPDWLLLPSSGNARAVLSLAAVTLLFLPTEAASDAWKKTIKALQHMPEDLEQQPSQPALDSVAATSFVDVTLQLEGCGRPGCSAGRLMPSLRDDHARYSLLTEASAIRRLNAHHYSCWHSPRCHQRMYVMDLPRSPVPRESLGARQLLDRGWLRRVPQLFRVDDGTRFGPHKFTNLSDAWQLRGRDLGFDTGGMNLDTTIGLQLTVSLRTRLAAQFLALPVGRDMMLWNIIVGRGGLYAIDQEGHAFEDGSVPWGQRVWPYCISVRDCYEKALGALCGRQRPTQPLSECFTALTRAELCPDASRPFPCPNGCQATFLDCRGRKAKEASFVTRDATNT